MHLFALGINHHSAPVALRERVSFQPERLDEALGLLIQQTPVREAAILSTCNRTELYCTTETPEAVADWLAGYHALNLQQIAPHLFTLPDTDAVRHVFRVAAGLDSMVLGEPQILGQMKHAARTAERAGTLGTLLHKLFQKTFSVAKEIRATTAIGANIVSLATAALRMTERIFDAVANQRVLFIGAGEMIELTATHFASAKPRQITIANRTLSRAEALARRFGGDALALDALPDALANYDVVVSCTASPLPIIGLGMIERALKARRHRPMVLVDLAVPRDFEAEIGNLDDAFLFTLDELSHVIDDGMASRQQAVSQAEAIIGEQVSQFLHWVDAREAVPAIKSLRSHAEHLRQAELERARARLARGEDPAAVLEALSHGLTNKFLHGPTQYLNRVDGGQLPEAVALLRQLYPLDKA